VKETMAEGEKALVPDGSRVSGQANKPMSRPAHALSHVQVIQELGCDSYNGLSSSVAKQRLEELGKNELGDSEGVSPLKIVVAQIANAMTLVRFIPRHCLMSIPES
jgi:magnesium-transporting ATPase (P-type)